MATNETKLPAIVFTTTGKIPSEATFTNTVSEIKQYIANTASGYLGQKIREDNVSLVITRDDKNTRYNEEEKRNEFGYIISWQIWLPRSFSLYDNTEEIPMLGRPMGNYSENLINFIKKFTNLDNKNIGRAIVKSNDGTFITLDYKAIIEEMFDVSGYYYCKKFDSTDKPCQLLVDTVFKDKFYNRRANTIDFGDRQWYYGEEMVEVIKVTKTYANESKIGKAKFITKAKKILVH